MISTELGNNDRLISIKYTTLTNLMEREEYITNTLRNNLERNGNRQYIKSTYTTFNKDNKYHLNFILSPSK